MNGDIHDVSLTLGKLLSEVSEGHRQREAMFRKLDVIADAVQQAVGQTLMVANDLEAVKKKISAIEPVIEDFKSIKQRGIGMIAAVGLIGGGVGAGMTKFFAAMGKAVGFAP